MNKLLGGFMGCEYGGIGAWEKGIIDGNGEKFGGGGGAPKIG